MKIRKFAIAVLFCFFVAAADSSPVQVPETVPDFSTEENAKLNSGEPVHRSEVFDLPDGARAGRGVVYIRVNAKPDAIFERILDFDKYVEFYPHVGASKLYKQQDDLYFAQFTLKLAGVVKITYHCRHELNRSNNTLHWTLDDTKKNDFKQTIGFWKIWELQNGQSLLAYSIYVDSGRKIPKMIEQMATGYGLKKVAKCMKVRVETGGVCKH